MTASVADTFRVPASPAHPLPPLRADLSPLPSGTVGKSSSAICRKSSSVLFSHLPNTNKSKYPYVLRVSDRLLKHSYFLGSYKIINSLHFGCYYHYNVFSIKIEVLFTDLKMPGQGLRDYNCIFSDLSLSIFACWLH